MTTQFPPIQVFPHDPFEKHRNTFSSQKRSIQQSILVSDMVIDTGLTENHIFTAPARVPQIFYSECYPSKRGVPAGLKRMYKIVSNPSDRIEERPSKRDLLSYIETVKELHPGSHLLRLCVRRLMDFYRKPTT